VAAQAGKYLFMAIMIPPYLLTYGIPRWFLMTAVPEMYFFIKNETMRIGRFVQEISARIADLMKGILQQMLGDSLRLINQRAQNLWGHLKDGAHVIAAKTAQLMKFMLKAPLNVMEALANASALFIERARQLSRHVTDRTEKWQHKVADMAASTAHWINQTLVAPAIAWLAAVYAPVASFAAAARNKVSESADAIADRLKRMTDPLTSAFERSAAWALEKTRRAVKTLVDPVKDWMAEKLNSTMDRADKILRAVAQPIERAAEAIKDKAKSMADVAMHVGQQIIQVPQMMLQAVFFLWTLTPQTARRRVANQQKTFGRWGRNLKSVFKGAVEGVKELAAKTGPVRRRFRNFRTNLKLWIIQALKWLRYQLIMLPLNIKRAIIYLAKLTGRILSKGVMGLRHFIALISALFGYAFITMKELTAEMTGWFSRNRNIIKD
jgi:hypothetical protein